LVLLKASSGAACCRGPMIACDVTESRQSVTLAKELLFSLTTDLVT
jgi:hypothetical protein